MSAWVVPSFRGQTSPKWRCSPCSCPWWPTRRANTGQQAPGRHDPPTGHGSGFDRKRAWLAVVRELRIGVLNGVIIASLVFCAVLIISAKPMLALVMGAALGVDMLLGAFAGAGHPAACSRKLGRDPAQASSIILTTITDSMGFSLPARSGPAGSCSPERPPSAMQKGRAGYPARPFLPWVRDDQSRAEGGEQIVHVALVGTFGRALPVWRWPRFFGVGGQGVDVLVPVLPRAA